VNALISLLAALAASGFAVDLYRGARAKPRPHVTAYAAGMACFALATWALFLGVTIGWSGPVYKVFFLFGAVINIPVLATGSLFLVIGRRTGRFALALLLPFSAWTALVILPAALTSLPAEGVPRGSETFVVGAPPIMAAIGGGVGATVLIGLALVSVVRFWRKDRSIVFGNALIVAGTLSAASGGSMLALTGEEWGFAASLLAAATLIWVGYRVASGRRSIIVAPGAVEIPS